MSCMHPLLAKKSRYKFGDNYTIKIISKDVYPDEIDNSRDFSYEYITLPCGKCEGCKQDRSRDWMIRCFLESLYYPFNWFITLTYDDEHLGSLSLNKKDFQDFIQNLRNYFNYRYGSSNIRYVVAGEYGSLSGRKHFHCLLFNCDIPDIVPVKAESGIMYFESKIISDCWSKGNCLIGFFGLAQARYVAQYTLKKLGHKRDASKYEPEFIMSSNRPGIGYKFFVDNYEMIIADKGIYIESKLYPPPKYFYKVMEQLDIDCQSVKDYWLSKLDKEVLNAWLSKRNMRDQLQNKEIIKKEAIRSRGSL